MEADIGRRTRIEPISRERGSNVSDAKPHAPTAVRANVREKANTQYSKARVPIQTRQTSV